MTEAVEEDVVFGVVGVLVSGTYTPCEATGLVAVVATRAGGSGRWLNEGLTGTGLMAGWVRVKPVTGLRTGLVAVTTGAGATAGLVTIKVGVGIGRE